MDASSPLLFVGASFELAAIDLLLGADNAILIALACRTLPPAMRPRALVYAVGGAVALRFLLAGAAGFLMKLPFVKLVGALVLIAIAIELLAHAQADKPYHGDPKEPPEQAYDDRFWRAVAAVIGADAVMSLDNVLALASIAQGNLPLLAVGIALAIPALAFGSLFVARVLDRWPILVVGGAALLGWVAGQMAVTDAFWDALVERRAPVLAYVVPALCATFVVVWWRFGPEKKVVAPTPPRVLAPRAQKAIEVLAASRWRKRNIFIGATAFLVAIGSLLLIAAKMRN
jgi:YjbE family integral membrane protein